MKKGRYNILIAEGVIKKFNVYMNDYRNYFIYFEGDYQMVEKYERYRGGWLWKIKEEEAIK